ncbi:uncharacterized protein Tco025E_00345 [Trypanosoma conorhini]|uniref:H/ACA ribonucleoprotein complex subunit n=1 Tax=Trypanosoma conorhini TaxID=83891 RepID=A0A3R7LFK2_9TRYP|nr:uncharacterized protein Tco025E_00345 [Trypanosoma conorhini]RNF27415.1 hypothetical protein Tco025E_00345 [Trypanosoma conorhini]
MDASSVGSSCDLTEDVRGVRRRRRVSLSSVDSEPIPKRCRPDAEPHRAAAAAAAVSAGDGEEDGGTRGSHARDDAGDSDASEGPEAGAGALHRAGSPSAEEQAALRDANGDPLLQIPLERVSEAVAAVVTGLIARSSTVVADNAAGAPAMDAGTRLCLKDGAVVGVVATVMGPVAACAYAVVCLPAVFDALCGAGRLVPGADLRYDLGEQRIIFDPAAQCDMRRGTDASYINDEELPPHARPDFSDDEAERQWKMRRRMDADAEPLSDDDVPVDVDWAKLDALEAGLRAEPAAPQQSNRLVVPPWVAAAPASTPQRD